MLVLFALSPTLSSKVVFATLAFVVVDPVLACRGWVHNNFHSSEMNLSLLLRMVSAFAILTAVVSVIASIIIIVVVGGAIAVALFFVLVGVVVILFCCLLLPLLLRWWLLWLLCFLPFHINSWPYQGIYCIVVHALALRYIKNT